MSDDPGVLGNLPRSRPGRRSEKRGGAWSEAAESAAGAGAAATPKRPARKPRQTQARKTTAAQRPRRQQPRPKPQPQQQTTDPVSGAIRAAGGLAEAGVKTAVKVAGGVIKRLPRP